MPVAPEDFDPRFAHITSVDGSVRFQVLRYAPVDGEPALDAEGNPVPPVLVPVDWDEAATAADYAAWRAQNPE